MEHYFLFFIGFVWILFATIQDLKTREVANWLNFSLIAFALAYKAFFSLEVGDLNFFLYGLMGFAIFFGLAFAFYYGRVFAGGDAKLLMGIGAVLPFERYSEFISLGGGFFILFLLTGLVWTVLCSGYIALSNRGSFMKNFKIQWNKNLFLFILAVIVSVILQMAFKSWIFWIWSIVVLFAFVILYDYVKAVDNCMIKLVDAKKLTEGDWLEQEVKIRGKLIRKSIHGLSWENIKLLREAGKKVWIKEGVPFVPAFLISYLIMVYVLAVLKFELGDLVLVLMKIFS